MSGQRSRAGSQLARQRRERRVEALVRVAAQVRSSFIDASSVRRACCPSSCAGAMQLRLAGADGDAEHAPRPPRASSRRPRPAPAPGARRAAGSAIAASRSRPSPGSPTVAVRPASSPDLVARRTRRPRRARARRRPCASTALTAIRCSHVPKRAARLEARQAAPGLHEGFLGAVLGRCDVAGHAQAQSVDPARRAAGRAARTPRTSPLTAAVDQPPLLGRLAVPARSSSSTSPPPPTPTSWLARSRDRVRHPTQTAGPVPPETPLLTTKMHRSAKRFARRAPCQTPSASSGRARSATVILDRPRRPQCRRPATAAALAAAFLDLDADERVNAIVLWGAGGTFCAGADLAAVAAGWDPSRLQRSDRRTGRRRSARWARPGWNSASR